MHTTNDPTLSPKRKIDKFSPKERRFAVSVFHVLLLSLFFVKVPKKRSPRKRPIAWPSSGASTLFFTKGGTPYRHRIQSVQWIYIVPVSDRPLVLYPVPLFRCRIMVLHGIMISSCMRLLLMRFIIEIAPHCGHLTRINPSLSLTAIFFLPQQLQRIATICTFCFSIEFASLFWSVV